MPCGESSLIKGIANQAGLYISFKSFCGHIPLFPVVHRPGEQTGFLPQCFTSCSASRPFQSNSKPDLGSSGRPWDWGWAAEARKQCARGPRFIPKDSFCAKHPGDACCRASGCRGGVCLGHGPVTIPPAPCVSTCLPPAGPLGKPRLPERQDYLSRSPTSRELRRGSGQCTPVLLSGSSECAPLGGAPGRWPLQRPSLLSTTERPQLWEGPAPASVVLLHPALQTFSLWSHPSTHTHMSQSQNSKLLSDVSLTCKSLTCQ